MVIKGPGPIIKCCRKPLNKREYPWLFQETGVHVGVLSRAMEGYLPKGTVSRPREHGDGDDNDLKDKQAFSRRKGEAKKRLVYHSHYAPPLKLGELSYDPLPDSSAPARRKSPGGELGPRLNDTKLGPPLTGDVYTIVNRTIETKKC